MVHALLVGCGLLATATPPDPGASRAEVKAYEAATEADLLAYEQARAHAKRDPDAHVRLALWCEAHGLDAERLRHLTLALLADPKHAAARGLMGLVAYGGRWQKPGDVAEKVRADAEQAAALAEYNERRSRAANTADAQWQLALWCEEHGLAAEATAHLSAVVRLDPSREEAWKRLGYKRHNNRWMTDAQVAAAKADAEAQKQADRRWKPLLEKWKGWLSDDRKRAEAEKALAGVTDPRAVPSVCRVFGTGGASHQGRAVQVLGQIDAPGASRALGALAVSGRSAEVRRVATETLTRRDAREFADLLIGLLREPVKYEVRPVGGPGSAGELFVEGTKFNRKRLYSPPPAPDIPFMPGDRVDLDASGLPVIVRSGPIRSTGFSVPGLAIVNPYLDLDRSIDKLEEGWSGFGGFPIDSTSHHYSSIAAVMRESYARRPFRHDTTMNFFYRERVQIPVGRLMAEAQKTAATAQGQLEGDIAAIERYNATVRRSNERILPILRQIAGQDLGEGREAWKGWWVDQIGYAYLPQRYSDNPTIVENVPLAYQPRPIPITTDVTVVGFRRVSCFGAGTPVHTLSGTRPIESLRVGDRVLTQDTATGALGYLPILVVHHNPPSKTFQIALGGETIVSSPFHRFWLAGRGWKMARDLAVGDTLRTLGGLKAVTAVEEGEAQLVYNLDVAETASFFVGEGGALVHDNTLPSPSLKPFDAGPALAVRAGDLAD